MTSSGNLYDARTHTHTDTYSQHTHTHTHTALCEPACCLASVVLDSLQILWTVAHQAPLSMGFSRKEYWRGLPCPPSGIFMMHTYTQTHTHTLTHTHTALCEPACYLASVVLDCLQTLWTVAHQAPLYMGFSRKEYWRGLPCRPLEIFMTRPPHTHTQTHTLLFVSLRATLLQWRSTLCRPYGL